MQGQGAADSSLGVSAEAARQGIRILSLVLLAMIFEFGRPQDFLPPLKVIPFPTLLDVSLALAVFRSGKPSFSNKQTKLWIGLLVFMAHGCHLRTTTIGHS